MESSVLFRVQFCHDKRKNMLHEGESLVFPKNCQYLRCTAFASSKSISEKSIGNFNICTVFLSWRNIEGFLNVPVQSIADFLNLPVQSWSCSCFPRILRSRTVCTDQGRSRSRNAPQGRGRDQRSGKGNYKEIHKTRTVTQFASLVANE